MDQSKRDVPPNDERPEQLVVDVSSVSRATHIFGASIGILTFVLQAAASGIVGLFIFDHIRSAESMSHVSWVGHVALVSLFVWAGCWAFAGVVAGVKAIGGDKT